MKKYLRSEVDRLVYGYLESKGLTEAAEKFLETSKPLEECRQLKQEESTFDTKINGQTMQNILDEHSTFCGIIAYKDKGFVNPNEERIRKCNMLKNIMQDQIPENLVDERAEYQTLDENNHDKETLNPVLNIQRSLENKTDHDINLIVATKSSSSTDMPRNNVVKTISLKPSAFKEMSVIAANHGMLASDNFEINNDTSPNNLSDVQSFESDDLNDAASALRTYASDNFPKIPFDATVIQNSTKTVSSEHTSPQDIMNVNNAEVLNYVSKEERSKTPPPDISIVEQNGTEETSQTDSGFLSVFQSTPIVHCSDIAQRLTSTQLNDVCLFLNNILKTRESDILCPNRIARSSKVSSPRRKPKSHSLVRNGLKMKSSLKRKSDFRRRRRRLHAPPPVRQASEELCLRSSVETSHDEPLPITAPISEQTDQPIANNFVDFMEVIPKDIEDETDCEVLDLSFKESHSQSFISEDDFPVDADKSSKTPEKEELGHSDKMESGTIDEFNGPKLHEAPPMESYVFVEECSCAMDEVSKTPEKNKMKSGPSCKFNNREKSHKFPSLEISTSASLDSYMQLNDRLTEVTITPVQNMVPVALIADNMDFQGDSIIIQLPDSNNVPTIPQFQQVPKTAYVRPLRPIRPKLRCVDNPKSTQVCDNGVANRNTVNRGKAVCAGKARNGLEKPRIAAPNTKNQKNATSDDMSNASGSVKDSQSTNCSAALRENGMDKSVGEENGVVNNILTFDSDLREFLIPGSSREADLSKSIFSPVPSNSRCNTPSLPQTDNEVLENSNLEQSEENSYSIVASLLHEEEFHSRLADLINEGFLNTPQKAISKSSIKDQLENVVKQVIEVTEQDPLFEEMLLDLLPLDDNSELFPNAEQTSEQPQQDINSAIAGISDKFNDRMEELSSRLVEDSSQKDTSCDRVEGDLNQQANNVNLENSAKETRHHNLSEKVQKIDAIQQTRKIGIRNVTNANTDKNPRVSLKKRSTETDKSTVIVNAKQPSKDEPVISSKKTAKGNSQKKETPLFLKRTNIYSNFVQTQTEKKVIKHILPKTNSEKPWDSFIRSFTEDDIINNPVTSNPRKKRRNKRNISQVNGGDEGKAKCTPKKSKRLVDQKKKNENPTEDDNVNEIHGASKSQV